MKALACAALVLFALAAAGSTATAAERLIASLSTHRVLITSNFTGVQVVLFGSVERDAGTPPRRGGYDVIATVTGPRQSLVTRRKERVVAIWVNLDSRTFVDVPSYLAVLSSRPFEAIATSDVLRRQQIGFANILLTQQIGPDVADVVHDDPFRRAFVRLKAERGLYIESPGAVTFLTPTLFQASIPLPAEVPVGSYEVDVKLFADGALIARTTSAFETVKVGFERFVAASAHDHGLAYGVVTAAMALMTGWLASIIFRKD